MNVIPITQEGLGRRLGLVALEGKLSVPGVADLVREAVARWGPVRAQVVRLFVKRNAEAAGFNDVWADAFDEAVKALIALREVEEVLLAAPPPSDGPGDGDEDDSAVRRPVTGTHLVISAPHVVAFGDLRLVIGDVSPERVERFGPPGSAQAVARWVDSSQAERLFEEGSIPWAARDWLGPTTLRSHAERRGVAADVESLWHAIEGAVKDRGDPVDDSDSFDVIGGAPGTFFGRSGERTGRWRRGGQQPDGVWLGTSRGYRDQHRHPFALLVADGVVTRALPLFDLDELWWALIGRGSANGTAELVHVERDVIRLSCPLPWDLWRLSSLCDVDVWRWRTPAGLGLERELASWKLGVQLDPRGDNGS